MCGRYAIHSSQRELVEYFKLAQSDKFIQRFNVAPASKVPVIRLESDKPVLVNCHWGLIPHWARDTKIQPINARAETIADKPFFKSSFRNKRCLIPANGYYEWKNEAGKKQPYYCKLKDTELFAFAGLWDRWEQDKNVIDSCTIITTEANISMSSIHHRMPVILEPGNYHDWLAAAEPGLLKPYAGRMKCYPVSTNVNNPANNSKSLIQPIA
ncbi:MAG: SOS response-associated peptidase [Gammaproteobacteria bacterium]